jgi:hypothetical protein
LGSSLNPAVGRKEAPGSIGARRAGGRGRRGPPAARLPSRCRGTASSTLRHRQASKRSVNRSTADVNKHGGDPERIAPDLGPVGRRSVLARQQRTRVRGAGRKEGRRGARVLTFLVEVVVLLHDERLRHGREWRSGRRGESALGRGKARAAAAAWVVAVGAFAGFGVKDYGRKRETEALQECRSGGRHGSESGTRQTVRLERVFLSFRCKSTVAMVVFMNSDREKWVPATHRIRFLLTF